jgi:hypothetical protein
MSKSRFETVSGALSMRRLEGDDARMSRRYLPKGLLMLWLAAAACASAFAAENLGTVTILDGEATIVRGAGRLRAAEGVRLAPGDIVETASGAFMQIELIDQTVLQLGGTSRAMVGGLARYKAERTVYALSGWFKATNARKDAAARGFELRSPLFEIATLPGVLTVQIKVNEVALFAERGDIRLVERQAGVSGAAVSIKSGHFYRRASGTRGATSPTAAAAFVADMPRAFRDSLPLRAERFKEREVVAKPAPDFSYADVEPWLKAESPMRRQFVERWRVKARDPAFRAALIANLQSHYEWDPVLFPEKYLPKDPASAPTAASATGALAPRSAP